MRDSTFAWLVTLAAGLTTLIVFGKHVWAGMIRVAAAPVRFIREQSAAAREVMALRERQEDIAGKVKRIMAEVLPNGGGSLKDAITRIETLVADGGQRVRALLTDAPDGYVEADANGNWTWANRTLCRLMGRQCEELYGRGWEQCVDPAERTNVIDEWDRCIEVGREFFMNVHCRKPNGDRVYMQVHSYVMRNKITGAVTGCIARCQVIPPDMERSPHGDA